MEIQDFVINNPHNKHFDSKIKRLTRLSDKIAIVEYFNYVLNIVDRDGNILFPDYSFRFIESTYNENFARVQREDGYWNYIDENGELLSPNLWFKKCGLFLNDYAVVLNEKDIII